MHKEGLFGGGGLQTFAERAIERKWPEVLAIIAQGKRDAMSVSIVNNDGVQVASRDHGTEDRDKYDFSDIALRKARLSARTKMDTANVLRAPQLYLPGDPPFPGGVTRPMFHVGASGIEGDLDVRIADILAEGVQEEANEAFSKELVGDPDAIPADISATDEKPGDTDDQGHDQ